jgi:hypothetical protein
MNQFLQNGGAGIIAGLLFGAVMAIIHYHRFYK